MGRDLHYVPGSFYRTDDRTGFPQRAERTKKQWNGIIVDETVWEARQPQDLVKGVKDDQTVPEARPLAPNVFVGPTFVQLSAFADVLTQTLELQSTAGFSVGLVIAVMLDSGVLFESYVTAVGVGEVIIAGELPAPASSGNLVTNYHRFVQAPPAAPVNTVAPAISGLAVQGRTLSCSTGTWLNNPLAFAYQWRRDGSAIGGATSSLYLLVGGDNGKNITCDVTASNAVGPATESSNTVVPTAPVAPVFTSPPFITGTGVEGSVATGHIGTVINDPTGFIYAWKINGVATGDAGLTIVIPTGHVGDDLTFDVTASNDGGSVEDVSAAVTILTSGGADIPIADITALYAMLDAGEGVSGDKSYILAPGDYGEGLFPNYDFAAHPIVIKGQAGVSFEYIDLVNVSGITWGPTINLYGHADGGNGPALRFNNCQHCVSDNVTMHTGAGDDLAHPGIAITFRDSSFITIKGTVGTLTASGHGSGVGFIAPCDHISFQGYSQRNINTDGMINGGCSQITVNQYLCYDMYPQPGDHPDAYQWFSTTGHPVNDITVTNSMYFQGIGRQSQGFFGEGDGSNHTFDTCATWGGMVGTFEQSGGTGASWNNCFAQSYPTTNGGVILIRGGAVNASVTNCFVEAFGTYGPEAPYPGYTQSGNTIIPTAASPTDYSRLDVFLAANPLVPARPY